MKIFRFCEIALLSLAISSAMAEESGAFIGLNVGYGAVSMDTDFTFNDNGNGITSQKGKLADGGGVNYGVIAGYKQFFTPYFGLRYYANINALHASLKPTALMQAHANISTNQNITLLNYGVNVDFLANFVANCAFDFGAFIGLGIGGNSYFGKDLDNYIKAFVATKSIHQNVWRIKDTHFDFWLNAGLRANFAKYNGLEIFSRVPFMKSVVVNNTLNSVGATTSLKTSIKNAWNVGARYTASF